MAKSTDESKAITAEIQRQYEARNEGRTFSRPVSGVVGLSPQEREHEERLRAEAEAELHEEQVKQKMDEIRARRGKPFMQSKP